MRKNVGVILLCCGMGMLVALFGLLVQRYFGEGIVWAYYLSIMMIYCGAMMTEPEEEDEDDEDD